MREEGTETERIFLLFLCIYIMPLLSGRFSIRLLGVLYRSKLRTSLYSFGWFNRCVVNIRFDFINNIVVIVNIVHIFCLHSSKNTRTFKIVLFDLKKKNRLIDIKVRVCVAFCPNQIIINDEHKKNEWHKNY